jgi:hypothetical protein
MWLADSIYVLDGPGQACMMVTGGFESHRSLYHLVDMKGFGCAVQLIPMLTWFIPDLQEDEHITGRVCTKTAAPYK